MELTHEGEEEESCSPDCNDSSLRVTPIRQQKQVSDNNSDGDCHDKKNNNETNTTIMMTTTASNTTSSITCNDQTTSSVMGVNNNDENVITGSVVDSSEQSSSSSTLPQSSSLLSCCCWRFDIKSLLGWFCCCNNNKQLFALIQKNFIIKVRTPIPTFFEILSPVFMMLILVAAYTLSEITYKDARHYTIQNYTIPPPGGGPIMDIIKEAIDHYMSDANENNNGYSSNSNNNRLLLSLLKEEYQDHNSMNLHRNSLNSILDSYNDNKDDNENELFSLISSTSDPFFRRRQQHRFLQQEFEDDDDDDEFVDDDSFNVLDDMRREINKILKSPITIPTFNQYVYLSTLLSSLLDSDQIPNVISDSSYVKQWGNLLTLGTIHISPKSHVLTNDFWLYLNTTYPLLLTNNLAGNTPTNRSTSPIVKVRIHENENMALDYINSNLNERTWVLIDFSSSSSSSPSTIEGRNNIEYDDSDDNDLSYKIRMNYTTLPNTNELIAYAGSIGLNKEYQKYYLSGYLTIQQTINNFALQRIGATNDDNDTNNNTCNNNASSSLLYSMPMPTSSYSQNQFYTAVGYLLGLTMAMAFMYPVSRLIKLLVEEKETKMKEILFMLGVKPFVHWLSWIITSCIIFLIITILVTVTLTNQVLKYSSPAFIFVYIGLFCTSTIGFSFFISSFFTKSKLAAIIGPVALFATLLPRFIFFGSNRYEATTGKYVASLLPCTAFAFGADIIAEYEYSQQGVHTYNASQGDYSFNTALFFLFIDTFIYMFLGWYLDLTLPRKYGVRRKWYFIFVPKFWFSILSKVCCFRRRPPANNNDDETDNKQDNCSNADSQTTGDDHNDLINFEHVNDDDPTMIPRVQIKDLVKCYNNNRKKKKGVNDNNKPAVDHLNLQMYESQITCLLGHNGAGKTSTIGVLTGLYPPTSGDCYVYDNSIVNDLQKARKSMGICPQHNVLFDKLTDMEHLYFFERIKDDLSSPITQTKLKERAVEIGLGEYLNTTSIALSGGNKRKLSVAIALCGDPKFVLLDEPTTGMDPASRRSCWELLRRKRNGRVTLLTTHFMDEAELLADRIAIMKEGRLQCVGSALFLKNRFGLGYNLTVVLNNNINKNGCTQSSVDDIDSDETNDLMEAGGVQRQYSSLSIQDVNPTTNQITEFLNNHIANTELVRKSAREVTYRFPQGTEDEFPETFDELENNRHTLGIGSYGVSNTTLEDVFLQLAKKEETDESRGPADTSRSNHATSSGATPCNPLSIGIENNTTKAEEQPEDNIVESNRGETTFSRSPSTLEAQHMSPIRQILLLYKKRFLIQKRDLKGAFFMVVLPAILIALVFLVLTIDPKLDGPPLAMDLNLYDQSPSGSYARTEVVVGGGASLRQPNATYYADISQMFTSLSSTMKKEYKHANFSHIIRATSSDEISRFLLDTINNHDHHERYGAYIFRDSIGVILSVDWDAIKEDLKSLSNITTDGNAEPINLRDLLDFGDNAGPLQVKLNIADISDTLYNASSIAPETIVDLAKLQASISDITVALPESSQGIILSDLAKEVFVNATTVLNATKLNEIIETLSSGGDSFARSAVQDAYVQLINDVISILGTENEVNASGVVADVFAYIDNVASNYNSSTSALLAFPIFVLDESLKQLTGMPDPITVGDLFLDLNEFLGGSNQTLDAYLWIEADAVIFHPSNMSFTITGLKITSASEQSYSVNETTISLDAITDILSILPNGTMGYAFEIDADASVMHNTSSPHAVAAFNQAYMEYIYKQCTDSDDARLISVNHPLPLTTQQSLEIKFILSILATFFLLIPLCYILGAFIVFPVKERVSKSKHLQLVSGVNMSAYWISTYLWDVTMYFLLSFIIMMVFLAYGSSSAQIFVNDAESFIATALLIFGYGLSALPFAYLFSRYFDNHSSAQIAIMGIFFITGFVAVIAWYIMSEIEKTKNIAEGLRPLFRTWPAYNVGEGLIQLAKAFWERMVLDMDRRPLDYDVAGKNILLVYILSIPYFILLLLLEYSADGGSGGYLGRILRNFAVSYNNLLLRFYGVRRRTDDGVTLLLDDDHLDGENHQRAENEDDDVLEERSYVIRNKDGLKESASVLLVNLWKVYPPSVGMFGMILSSITRFVRYIFCCRCFCTCCNRRQQEENVDEEDEDTTNLPKRAVRNLTTAVHEGETYGLLGVNGAGKTTTLGVLTGDVSPTTGEAYVAGYDVTGVSLGGVSKARKHIGYCPQVDPLLDLLTGRETLTMFARLRGIPSHQIVGNVTQLLEALTLTPHADKVTETYSGGNKRKLSLGVALIGNPKVLFIDEASSGMDPCARRKMWTLIEDICQCHKRSVILTTHSMEEAEALCTRVGIMVHGKLLCLNSVQLLKSTYLDGYTIDIHCTAGTSDNTIDSVVSAVLLDVLPGSVLSERHGRFLKFDLSSLSNNTSIGGLGKTFRKLQQLKSNHNRSIENYSISQCSLEQVFISLVGINNKSNNDDSNDNDDGGGGHADNTNIMNEEEEEGIMMQQL